MTVVDRAASGLVARTDPSEAFDPIAVYAAGVEAGLEAALWLRASEDLALVGLGRAWSVEADGPERFAEVDRAWRTVTADLGPDDPAWASGVGPVLLGGLGFTGRAPAADDTWAPFGAASLVLPAAWRLLEPRAPETTARVQDPGSGR